MHGHTHTHTEVVEIVQLAIADFSSEEQRADEDVNLTPLFCI